MSLLAAWIVFPLVLVACSLGSGLIVEAVAGRRLPLELLLAVGLLGFVVLADVATAFGRGAEIVSWIVVASSLAALVLRRRSIARPFDRAVWSGAILGALVLAAPFVATGQATFGAYGTLGDTSIQMLGAEVLPRIGRTTAGLGDSTVTATLRGYFAGAGYPAGPQAALGIANRTAGGDIFGTYAAFVVALGACTGLAVGAMCRAAGLRPLVLGAAVFAAVQAPLATAYVWQGSIKEVATMAAVAASSAAVGWWLTQLRTGGAPLRAGTVPAVAGASVVSASSAGAAPWVLVIGVFAVGGALVAARSRAVTMRAAGRSAAWGIALFAVLSVPTFIVLRRLVEVASGVLTSGAELGNLYRPLPWWQALTAWPVADYRDTPVGTVETVTIAMAVAIGALAALGVGVAARRGSYALVAWIASSLVAWFVIARAGSPWSDAKVMAIAAPAIFGSACIGASAFRGRARALGVVVLLIPIGATLWSNAHTYRGFGVAPVERLDELRSIDAFVDGRGAVLVPGFEEFAKVALVHSDPEVLGDPWRARTVVAADGRPAGAFTKTTQVDTLDPAAVSAFPWVLVRRGPDTSWPSGYEIARATRHYLLFRRASATAPGTRLQPTPGPDGLASAGIRCTNLRPGRVALVRPPASAGVTTTWTPRPASWLLHPAPDSYLMDTRGVGHISGEIGVPRPGRYEVWVEGSFNRPIDVSVNGVATSGVRATRNASPAAEPAGVVTLRGRTARVRLARRGGPLAPGGSNSAAGSAQVLGRVWLQLAGTPRVETATRASCDEVASDWTRGPAAGP